MNYFTFVTEQYKNMHAKFQHFDMYKYSRKYITLIHLLLTLILENTLLQK
jgi:hypothetical protein